MPTRILLGVAIDDAPAEEVRGGSRSRHAARLVRGVSYCRDVLRSQGILEPPAMEESKIAQTSQTSPGRAARRTHGSAYEWYDETLEHTLSVTSGETVEVNDVLVASMDRWCGALVAGRNGVIIPMWPCREEAATATLSV